MARKVDDCYRCNGTGQRTKLDKFGNEVWSNCPACDGTGQIIVFTDDDEAEEEKSNDKK